MNDGETLALDRAGRDATLTALVSQHPGALVAAIDEDGLFVDLPDSIELRGQQPVQARSALDLVDPPSRQAVIASWDRAKLRGAGMAAVMLVNGAEASLYFVDVRHRHGVFIGLIVADSVTELAGSLSERTPVMPKTGRVDKDEMAVIRFVDDRMCQILGYSADDLVGLRSLELIHPDDHVKAIDAWMEMLSTPGATTRLRARHRRKDGSWIWMEFTNSNMLKQANACVVTEMIDITDEMAALETLRQSEQLLGRLTEALPSGVLHIDHQRKIVYANARLHRMVGVGSSNTVDEQLANVIDDDQATLNDALDAVMTEGLDADIEVRLQIAADPKLHLCSIAIRALTDADDEPAGAIMCFDDVTESSELRVELERRATTDELTGCFNRAAVLCHLEAVLRSHAAGSPGTAVVFLDLDGFKEVNDTFGHRAGDHLLASAAARLRTAMRAGDVIGRLGGDEFIVVLPHISGHDQAMQIGMRLREALMEPIEIVCGLPMRIRSSIGVAWSSAIDVTPDALTAAADRAMYESKRVGASEPVYVSVS